MKFILLFILMIIVIFMITRNFVKDKKRIFYKSNYNIKNWMSMSRDQRKLIDNQDKYNSMIRKKKLLESIRREYNYYKRNIER